MNRAQRSFPEIADAIDSTPSASRKRKRHGKLGVHDPFDLIRWLAMSQPDPRKATAELVQNSLDAGASRIIIERFRRKGIAYLTVRDNGSGVIPDLPLEEALRYLATNIGHSRKRSLTPKQRHHLMTQGQYGIGLLGFWALGQRLEIRSHRPEQRVLRLILERDRPQFRIEGVPGLAIPEERKTEVIVTNLHKEAIPVLGSRRLADYLGSELRGQLLAREVRITINDRLARGGAPKTLEVSPRRFSGMRFELDSLATEERADGLDATEVQLDIFIDPTGRQEPLSLYTAGTLVASSFKDLGQLQLDQSPWTDQRLTGVIDYPLLTIPPGSRRGVLPDAAASRLRAALQRIAPRLEHFLSQEDERRAEEIDSSTVKRLQSAFYQLFEQLPRYELLPTEDLAKSAISGNTGAGKGISSGDRILESSDSALAKTVAETRPELSSEDPSSIEVQAASIPAIEGAPSGPLHSVEIQPSPLRMQCGQSRWLRALPFDQHGRGVDGECDYLWRLIDLEGNIESQPGTAPRVKLRAGRDSGRGRLRVVAISRRDPLVSATAEIDVKFREPPPVAGSAEGIPKPELVQDPTQPWRSRVVDERWQINGGHPGYRRVFDRPALRLRYLALLFAKEVVLNSSKNPRLNEPLEQLVEVFSFADRQLAGKGKR